jgi:Rrf2 family protein
MIIALIIGVNRMSGVTYSKVERGNDMFQFSKLTGYSLMILQAMYHNENHFLNSTAIVKMVDIPQPMLLKVLRQLRRAGYIQSSRGRGDVCGGYTLVKDLETTTIYDLVKALHGQKNANTFLQNLIPCESISDYFNLYGIRDEIFRINAVVGQELARNTLASLF